MSSLAADMGTIIRHLLRDPAAVPGFKTRFQPQEKGETATPRNLNAAFLAVLADDHLSSRAGSYLSGAVGSGEWGAAAAFYIGALDRVGRELSGPGLDDLKAAARDLARDLGASGGAPASGMVERFWNVFFPEGAGLLKDRGEASRDLRRRRTVTVTKLHPDPVSRPHEQILFTSNVLLTVPLDEDVASLALDPGLRRSLRSAAGEEQAFWYDHPIPAGIETERNEAVYGLRAMDEAVRFEIVRGNAPAGARVPVLLSISTTHRGLQPLANRYLAAELEKSGGIEHLAIHAAAEKDVRELLDDVILPAAGRYFPDRDTRVLAEVFGVDGEYGRHYSFLKAAAALWHVLVDREITATFKFDLDQAFPQEVLVSETGRSAFEHLSHPLWGAEGVDSWGREVELGMLAGALVNEGDIAQGLYTPDVKWPVGEPAPDQWIFASAWPQALSTEAEMMARYGPDGPDGRTSCLQRVHVTGGTTGIRVDPLRRHRPFTPSWMGRAEDQAYLLPVLFPEKGPALRYAHAGGLFMRHDKEAFAADALEAARTGKVVGDHVRILVFTSCARALPWGVEAIKEAVDPFTGCFISRIPVTVACLRMALQAAALFSQGSETAEKEGAEMIRVGANRLDRALGDFCDEKEVRKRLGRERAGWDLYYDVLDALERGIEEKDSQALSWRDRTRELIGGWRINTGEKEDPGV